MRQIKQVTYEEAIQYEAGKDRGIRIENMAKDLKLPKEEVQAFLVELEDTDAASLYLYSGNSRWCRYCCLANLDKSSTALAAALWDRHKKPPVDVRGAEELMLAASAYGLPMTVTDGNHRLMSQYVNFSLAGIRAYLCTHKGLRPSFWQAQRAYELSKSA